MSKSKSRLDHVCQSITNNIIAAIAAGVGQWKTPWSAVLSGAPANVVTGHFYRGINVLSLALASKKLGYSTHFWAGFSQWKAAGCKVRSGERGTQVLYARPVEVKDENDEVVSTWWSIHYSHVFNLDQVEGWQASEAIVKAVAARADQPGPGLNDHRIEQVEHLVRCTGAEVRTAGKAYYNVGGDYIGMPPIEAFNRKDPEKGLTDYYSTLLHELTHWTGSSSRCNRQLGLRGTRDYAFEELVAELGSAFLCASHGVEQTPREDHAQYIAYWVKQLEEDNRAIIKAARLAQESAEFLMGLVDEAERKQAA